MSARNIFRVIPNGEKWEIKKNGQILDSHLQKEVAMRKARKLAQNSISSHVLEYRRDGSIIKIANPN